MKNIVKTIKNIKAMQRQKDNKKPNCPLTFTGKKIRHIHAFSFFD